MAGPSILTSLDWGIQGLQLDACVLGPEPPVHRFRRGVAVPLPGSDLAHHRVAVGNPAAEAMAGQDVDLDPGHVQPVAVLGRVVNLEPPGQTERLLGPEGSEPPPAAPSSPAPTSDDRTAGGRKAGPNPAMSSFPGTRPSRRNGDENGSGSSAANPADGQFQLTVESSSKFLVQQRMKRSGQH